MVDYGSTTKTPTLDTELKEGHVQPFGFEDTQTESSSSSGLGSLLARTLQRHGQHRRLADPAVLSEEGPEEGPSSLNERALINPSPPRWRAGRTSQNLCKDRCGSPLDGFRLVVASMTTVSLATMVALIIDISLSQGRTEVVMNPGDLVVSDDEGCSKGVGAEALRNGGNAIDAAVATAFCLALVEPHVSGLGGSGLMLIHQHRINRTIVLDFREAAPANTGNTQIQLNPNWATSGTLSVGIPGFVKGLETAHQKYGSGKLGIACCSWSSLLYLAIRHVLQGNLTVSQNFVNATRSKLTSEEAEMIRDLVLTHETEPPSSAAQRYLEAGIDKWLDIPIFLKLVNSVKKVADEGSKGFYSGEIAESLSRATGGAITAEDLRHYQVKERAPIITSIGDYQVMTSPVPSSGPALIGFLNTMEALKRRNKKPPEVDSSLLDKLSRILGRLEALRQGLGEPKENDTSSDTRSKWITDKANVFRFVSELPGEPVGFESSYGGTLESVASSIIAVDRKDNYVSMVTSLNTWFGSKVMTDTGILLNNAMSSFALPSKIASTAESLNVMESGKRPLTRNVVALAMHSKMLCGRRILLGGASADHVGQVLAYPLLYGSDLKLAVDSPRIKVTDDGSIVSLEVASNYQAFSEKTVSDFRRGPFGRRIQNALIPYPSVNTLEKTADVVLGYSDPRASGILFS